ncbi:hypothetical protein MTP99_009755 [Tenebrio molitor]|jgi:hypothetical protein|nr:hypothetical protein MTP99_009755 [Tenebrio molitor]
MDVLDRLPLQGTRNNNASDGLEFASRYQSVLPGHGEKTTERRKMDATHAETPRLKFKLPNRYAILAGPLFGGDPSSMQTLQPARPKLDTLLVWPVAVM